MTSKLASAGILLCVVFFPHMDINVPQQCYIPIMRHSDDCLAFVTSFSYIVSSGSFITWQLQRQCDSQRRVNRKLNAAHVFTDHAFSIMKPKFRWQNIISLHVSFCTTFTWSQMTSMLMINHSMMQDKRHGNHKVVISNHLFVSTPFFSVDTVPY